MTHYHIQLFIQQQWAGLTVHDLFRHIWEAPKKQVHEMRMNKSVFVNDHIVNWTSPLQGGDKLDLYIPIEKDTEEIIASSDNPQILYHDDHLLIANKPQGMATHPNEKNTNTLVNAVAHFLKQQGESARAYPIHRLDKDTTGAVIFAKHPLSKAILDRMLEKRTIKRTYLALVDGIIEKNKGSINQPIGRDRHHPTRRRVSTTGQHAQTHFNVLKTFQNEKLTLIECKLDTGRTHQIRVHLSYIGFPLAGDQLYGGRPIFLRQALHARKITFHHPFTLENIDITAPFLDKPPIFYKYLSGYKSYEV